MMWFFHIFFVSYSSETFCLSHIHIGYLASRVYTGCHLKSRVQWLTGGEEEALSNVGGSFLFSHAFVYFNNRAWAFAQLAED
jgi:hypothetical protein